MDELTTLLSCAAVALAVALAAILVSGFRIALEYERSVVFRLGRFTKG